MFYTKGPTILRTNNISRFGVDTSEALSAMAEETWVHNPIPGILRNKELNDLNLGKITYQNPYSGLTIRERSPERMTHKQAVERATIDGFSDIKFKGYEKDGVSQELYNRLIELKIEEDVRRSTMDRGKGGFIEGTAKFATGLIVSLADPINIGVGMIPFVGQAKLGHSMSRSAIFAQRFKTGSFNGAIGSTLIEPLVYSSAQKAQLDYTMLDSLVNITFGALIGGGLHGLGGMVTDKWGKTYEGQPGTDGTKPISGSAANEVQNFKMNEIANAVKIATAQAMNGREVNITPFYDVATSRGRMLSEAELFQKWSDDTLSQIDSIASRVLNDADVNAINAKVDRINKRFINPTDRVADLTKKYASAIDPETGILHTSSKARAKARKQSQKELGNLRKTRAQEKSILRDSEISKLAKRDAAKIRKGEIPESYKDSYIEYQKRNEALNKEKPNAQTVRESMETMNEHATSPKTSFGHDQKVVMDNDRIARDLDDIFKDQAQIEKEIADLEAEALGRDVEVDNIKQLNEEIALSENISKAIEDYTTCRIG